MVKQNLRMKKGLRYCAGCINNEFADLNENRKEIAKKKTNYKVSLIKF